MVTVSIPIVRTAEAAKRHGHGANMSAGKGIGVWCGQCGGWYVRGDTANNYRRAVGMDKQLRRLARKRDRQALAAKLAQLEAELGVSNANTH